MVIFMCGRFTVTLSKDDFIKYLSRYKDIEIKIDDGFLPKYNIAPSEEVIIMLKDQKQYRVGQIKWGFIPSFIKEIDTFKPLINVRSETIYDKPIFKSNLISKRCVIFADSFYEWKTIHGRKVPFRIMLKNHELFAFAGIWSQNKVSDKPIYTAAIITTEANSLIKDIHHRMPVILSDDQIDMWLDHDFIKDTHLSLLNAYPSDSMMTYEVSPHVNHAGNKDKSCILNIESI